MWKIDELLQRATEAEVTAACVHMDEEILDKLQKRSRKLARYKRYRDKQAERRRQARLATTEALKVECTAA